MFYRLGFPRNLLEESLVYSLKPTDDFFGIVVGELRTWYWIPSTSVLGTWTGPWRFLMLVASYFHAGMQLKPANQCFTTLGHTSFWMGTMALKRFIFFVCAQNLIICGILQNKQGFGKLTLLCSIVSKKKVGWAIANALPFSVMARPCITAYTNDIWFVWPYTWKTTSGSSKRFRS